MAIGYGYGGGLIEKAMLPGVSDNAAPNEGHRPRK